MQNKVSTIKSRDLSVSLLENANTLHVTIVGSISQENSELLKQVFDRIANMQSEKVILNLYSLVNQYLKKKKLIFHLLLIENKTGNSSFKVL